MENVIKFFATIFMLITSYLMSGYVLSKLYFWIVCPIYGLPPITVAQAIGLSSIVGFLLLGVTMNMKTDVDDGQSFMVTITTKFIGSIFMYAIILLFGYIISLYI